MKENKNIERLFQEKFKEYEVLPPQEAWENIEARLQNKKKKRRVIPLWFKPTGIAAGIVIAIGLFNLFSNNNNQTINNFEIEKNNSNTIVNQIDEDENRINKNNDVNGKSNSIFENEANSTEGLNKIVRENEIVTDGSSNQQNLKNNRLDTRSNSKLKTPLDEKKNRLVFENRAKNKLSKSRKNNPIKSNDLVPKNGIDEKNIIYDSEDNLVSSSNKKSSKIKRGSENKVNQQKEDNKSVIDELISNNQNEKLASNLEKSKSSSNKLLSKEDNLLNELNNETTFNEVNIDTLKINQVLANNLEETKDSTLIAEKAEEMNELEQLLKEKEEGKNADEKEKEKRNKWAVSTNAAPVYFNSASEGSPLDNQFTSNEKSYQTSISYGVGFEYSLSKKLTIRSGLNKLSMSYDTQNVYYTPVMQSKMSTSRMNTLHVERNDRAKNVYIYNKVNDAFGDVDNFVQDEKGNLNQQYGYLEVPFEISYKIINKKVGIDVIGGMSTLFLQENNVSLFSSGKQMQIGEANNLNSINFSGNIGVGFRYTFWKSLNANFQPMLKYQFNTFSENSGNFKPYIVGLYTGLSYSF